MILWRRRQFVELYRYANDFDPERPCWWSDGVSGLDPGLSCRNGANASDKFCFADVMVSQSGWGHTTTGAAVEHGSGITDWKSMPVPYLMHESYDARTFPRLQNNLESYSGGLYNASVWLATSIARMEQLGLLEENEQWSVASERVYTMWLKAFIESFRLDNAVSGYEWWLGFDWLGASNGIIAGHENAWRPKAGIDNATLRTVQSEVVLLVRDPITLQSTAVYAGSSVAAEALLSNWTIGGYPSWSAAAELSWTARLVDGGAPFAHGTQPLTAGSVPQGETQPVANLSLTLPASLSGATKVLLELTLEVGGTAIASNSWRIPAFPKPAAHACDTAVLAEPDLLDAARSVCSNAEALAAGAFAPPSKPFVVLASKLRGDVADAARRLGGIVLILNATTEGQFPVCAVSEIGVVAPPFEHDAGQAWWFGAGEVGTLVYNTSWTATLADAATQSFMDFGFTSVVEKAQAFVLDDVNDTTVHIRSIPADIVADSSDTLIHDNALVWERALPGAAAGGGRFIVSGLSIFEQGSGQLRAEPAAKFVFGSLVDYAMQLAERTSRSHEEHQLESWQQAMPAGPAPPLCSRVSSICKAGAELPCEAVANAVAPIGLCSAHFAIATPTTRFFSDSAASGAATLEAVHVFAEPNDARNKDAQLTGLLMKSDTLAGPKTLLAQGTPVNPFTNRSFNGLQPVGSGQWVRLPMPSVSLPPGPAVNASITWIGVISTKDMTCFGVPRGGASPALGPLAPDSYAGPLAPGQAPASATWSAGGFSFSAYATVK